MTTATATITKERLQRIADRLREYTDELDSAMCRIEDTDEKAADAIARASALIDDGAAILERIHLA